MLIVNFHQPISINTLGGKECNIDTLHGMTCESILTIESFLSTGSYITFKGKLSTQQLGNYDSKDIVIKFYHSLSDNTNEFEIMKFVTEETSLQNIVPIPYVSVTNPMCKTYKISNLVINNVWKIIIYEYIPGIPVIHLIDTNVIMMANDIKLILDKLYSIGLVHADIHEENIIRTKNGKYRLIDFGQSFSTDNRFPPSKMMLKYNLISNKDQSINFFRDRDLDNLFKLITYLRYNNPLYASKL